jgi:DNA-binding transcriptional MerR regulator
MTLMSLRIGTLAERARTNAPTIRYYEQIGLLPRPNRRNGGQRRYGEEDVRRLTFIRRCREFGLPIEQVRMLASLVQDRGRSCMEARDIAYRHLTAIRAKLTELRGLEKSMAAFVESCESACAGGPGPDCAILEDLAKPSPSSSTRRGRKARA